MILNNQFMVKRQIGQGSYSKFIFLIILGEVFEAYDTKLGINVALKMEKEEISKVFLKHEYLMLYHLQNNNSNSNNQIRQRIPKIYNFYPNGKRNYYTLELFEVSLLSYMNNRESFINKNIGGKLYVVNEILSSLEEIHHKGYIHLDLKPSNIMVSAQSNTDNNLLNLNNGEQYPIVTLIDFGLTRPYKADYFDKGVNGKDKEFVGTLKYASLNAHTRQSPLDRIDDMWSFFFIVLEILNIKVPWNIEINKNERTKKQIIVSLLILTSS
jgi:serine/threonine protein kinase